MDHRDMNRRGMLTALGGAIVAGGLVLAGGASLLGCGDGAKPVAIEAVVRLPHPPELGRTKLQVGDAKPVAARSVQNLEERGAPLTLIVVAQGTQGFLGTQATYDATARAIDELVGIRSKAAQGALLTYGAQPKELVPFGPLGNVTGAGLGPAGGFTEPAANLTVALQQAAALAAKGPGQRVIAVIGDGTNTGAEDRMVNDETRKRLIADKVEVIFFIFPTPAYDRAALRRLAPSVPRDLSSVEQMPAFARQKREELVAEYYIAFDAVPPTKDADLLLLIDGEELSTDAMTFKAGEQLRFTP